MQLLITSHLLSVKRKSSTVEMTDIQRAYTLFLDQARSVEFLERNEREFISGKEWEDGGGSNGTDGPLPMQDVQA
jgi:RuvB-like protein 2